MKNQAVINGVPIFSEDAEGNLFPVAEDEISDFLAFQIRKLSLKSPFHIGYKIKTETNPSPPPTSPPSL